jgi:hypothetical protein
MTTQARANDLTIITDLADGNLSGVEWETWLAANPAAAEEVALARRVHALVGRLQAVDYDLPADFEARLLERVRTDATLLDLLDLGLSGVGRVLLDLLGALFAVFPQPQAV